MFTSSNGVCVCVYRKVTDVKKKREREREREREGNNNTNNKKIENKY